MEFYANQIFHVYNQGNNRQTIFYSEENYNYFIWKVKAYVLPFADIVSYCLMPNHFHWQLYVKLVEMDRKSLREHVDSIENKRRIEKFGENANPIDSLSLSRISKKEKITLSDSIGILQSSYTRAINSENGWSGSLFRKECKANDGWIGEFLISNRSHKNEFKFNIGNDYAFTCMEYIHDNPVKAGLVKNRVDRSFSSAKDYAGMREKSICNLELGKKLMGFM